MGTSMSSFGSPSFKSPNGSSFKSPNGSSFKSPSGSPFPLQTNDWLIYIPSIFSGSEIYDKPLVEDIETGSLGMNLFYDR